MAEIAQRRHRFPRVILLALIIVVCGVLLFVMSRIEKPKETEDVTYSLPLNSGQLFQYSADTLSVHDTSGEALLRIDTHPVQAIADVERGMIYWIEQSLASEQSFHAIRSLTIATAKQSQLYWSPNPLSALSVSADGTTLAFMESGDLYTVDVSDQRSRRVLTDVISYQWSPSILAFIIRTEESTFYAPLNQQGDIASQIPLHTAEETILGYSFAGDARVAMIKRIPGKDEDAEPEELYIHYDLSARREVATFPWPGNHTVTHRWIFSNPSGDATVVTEAGGTAARTTFLCRVIARQCEQVQQGTVVLGWIDDHQYLYTQLNADDRYTDVFAYDTITETAQLYQEAASYPTLLTEPPSL